MDTTDLRCPFCGSPFEAILEYTGRADSEHRDLVGYECEDYACMAAWDRDGNLATEPRSLT